MLGVGELLKVGNKTLCQIAGFYVPLSGRSMMSKIMKYKFLATALVAALATPAFATEGYYVGASGGEADAKDFDDVCDDLGSRH